MKKTTALLLAVIFILSAALAGTVAWLISETDPVTNTFTSGKIKITLQEHDWVATPEEGATSHLTDELTMENDDYFFIPGDTLEKDPWVTVKANSEKSYLFVRIKETNNYQAFNNTSFNSKRVINWSIDAGEDPTEHWVPYYELKELANGTFTMNMPAGSYAGGTVVDGEWLDYFPGVINLTFDGTMYSGLEVKKVNPSEPHSVAYAGNLSLLVDTLRALGITLGVEPTDTGEDFAVLVWYTTMNLDGSTDYVNIGVVHKDAILGGEHSVVITEVLQPEDAHYFYRIVDKSTQDQDFPILKDNQVTISPEFDSELAEIVNSGPKPALSFDAAAVQFDNLQGNTEAGKTAVDVAFDLVEWD